MPASRDWNTFESKPADSDFISIGAAEIRNTKIDIRQRMEEDHIWDDTTTTDGRHVKSTYLAGSDPTYLANYGTVYTKDVSGTIQLFYRDSAGTITQLTGGLALIQTGMIMMWHGTIATIPSGWNLCDGSNGTPDLRDKFIVGATQDIGGVANTHVSGAYTQIGGAATKSGSVDSHTLTTPEIPAHTHTMGYTNSGFCASGGNNIPAIPGSVVTGSTGGGGGHSHTFTNVDVLNPYYALAFIMKL